MAKYDFDQAFAIMGGTWRPAEEILNDLKRPYPELSKFIENEFLNYNSPISESTKNALKKRVGGESGQWELNIQRLKEAVKIQQNPDEAVKYEVDRLTKGKDIGNLTQEELSSLQGSLSRLSSIKGGGFGNTYAIADRIGGSEGGAYIPSQSELQSGKINTYANLLTAKDGANLDIDTAKKITLAVAKGEIKTDADIYQYIKNSGGNIDNKIASIKSNLLAPNAIKDLTTSTTISGSDYGGYNLQGILNQVTSQLNLLKAQGASQAELDSFIASLPEELRRGREAYLQGEAEYGAQVFQEDLAPRIKQQLASRGMLRSGDLASELVGGAGEIASTINEAALNLQGEDEAFFTSMAYSTKFRDEMEKGEAISSKLGYEREKASQEQAQTFTKTQAELNRKYNELVSKRSAERSYETYAEKLRRQNELAESEKESQMWGNVANVAGQIGTSAILGSMSKGTTT